MSPEPAPLTSSQLRALFDILTHHETYAEVESFKDLGGIEGYGYPFTAPSGAATESAGTGNGAGNGEAEGAGSGEGKNDAAVQPGPPSSAPLLQLLLIKLLLPMPGVSDLPADFWHVKFKGIMSSFAEAELSESYDKGALGTRKTLATASSAFHESITRGMLGGVYRGGRGPHEFQPDPSTARGLERAWDHTVREMVYGDLVDDLFDYATKSSEFESHSPALRDGIAYSIIHLATIMHRIFIWSPEGQYLIKLIESTHKLIPYALVSQTLRVGNAATMMSGLVRIFLAKVSLGGLTNWMGITKNASDGQNLMQRIMSMVLGWDAGDFKKTAENTKKAEEIATSGYLAVLDAHLADSRDQHAAIRGKSIEQQKSIVEAILEAAGDGSAAELTEKQHSLCMEYYSAQLSASDRDKIIQVMCRHTPDFTSSMVRDGVGAFDPIIRVLHENVDLRKYVVRAQKFVDDLIDVNKPKKDDSGQTVPPSIEDYVLLLRRHHKWLFKYLHEFAKGCPAVRERFHAWIKNDVIKAFQRDEQVLSGADAAEQPDPGAGAMSVHLQSIFSGLDQDVQRQVAEVLDRHHEYTTALGDLSDAHMQSILDGLAADDQQGPKVGSMNGPGVYHARWQSLLDETLITPRTASGPLRHGKDIKHRVMRGRMVTPASKDTWDLKSLHHQKFETVPDPPDVEVIVKALGPQFKFIVADVSSRGSR